MNYKHVSLKALKILLIIGAFVGIIQGTVLLSEAKKKIDVPASISGYRVYTESWEKGFVSAEGTWVISGEDQPDPFNKIEIKCFRSQNFCAVATGSLYEIVVNGEVLDRLLSTSLDVFDIASWDNQSISYKDVKPCAETTFSINRETKTVSGLRKYITSRAGCATYNPKEVTYTLSDGGNIYIEKIQKSTPVALNVFVATIALAFAVFGIYRVVRQSSSL